jgi:prenyl protein peptidase
MYLPTALPAMSDCVASISSDCAPLAGVSPPRAIWLCPLFFGTAHVHHAMQLHRQGHSAKSVVMNTALQFGYTYLFGAYACFVLLRSGHLASIVLIHALCNAMGLPQFGVMLHHPHRLPILAALGLGIAGFYVFFWPWSQ